MTHSVVPDDVSPKEKPGVPHEDGSVEQRHNDQKNEHDRPMRRNRYGGRGRRGDHHDPNIRYNPRTIVSRSRAERGRDRLQSGERVTRRRSYSDSYHVDTKQRDEGAGGDDRRPTDAERQVRNNNNNGDFYPRRRWRGGYNGYGGGRGRYGGDRGGYNRRPWYRRRYGDEDSDERRHDKRQTSEPPTRSSSESKDHKNGESKNVAEATGEQIDAAKKHESAVAKDKRQSHKSKSKRRESSGKSRRSPQPMLNENVLLHVFGTMNFETRCKAELVCHQWRRIMAKVPKPAADAPTGVTVLVKPSTFESRQTEPVEVVFDQQNNTINLSYRPRRYMDTMHPLARHLEKLAVQLGAGLEHILMERLAINEQILFAIGANLHIKSMQFHDCFLVGPIDFATLHSFMLYFNDRITCMPVHTWDVVLPIKPSLRRTSNRRRFQRSSGRDASAAKSTVDAIAVAEENAVEVATAGQNAAAQALKAGQ